MIPTEEEKTKILEAQMANPDIPLGNAEQFLLTLSSISELQARLSLWAFKLDFDGVESVSLSSNRSETITVKPILKDHMVLTHFNVQCSLPFRTSRF